MASLPAPFVIEAMNNKGSRKPAASGQSNTPETPPAGSRTGSRKPGSVGGEEAARPSEPPKLEDQYRAVEAQRGQPLTEAEKRIIERRFEEAKRVMSDTGFTYEESLKLLNDEVGEPLSGKNTTQKVHINAWNSDVDLHVAAGQIYQEVLNRDLPPTRENFLQVAREITSRAQGKNGTLPDYTEDLASTLDLVQKVKAPIDYPRYRLVGESPDLKGAIDAGNLNQVLKEISRSTVGGLKSTGYAAADVSAFNSAFAGTKAVVEYPPGMEAVAINGSGPVAKGAAQLQLKKGNTGFVPNEMMVAIPPGKQLAVAKVETVAINQNGLTTVNLIKLKLVDKPANLSNGTNNNPQ